MSKERATAATLARQIDIDDGTRRERDRFTDRPDEPATDRQTWIHRAERTQPLRTQPSGDVRQEIGTEHAHDPTEIPLIKHVATFGGKAFDRHARRDERDGFTITPRLMRRFTHQAPEEGDARTTPQAEPCSHRPTTERATHRSDTPTA